jgi:hypothetical protein
LDQVAIPGQGAAAPHASQVKPWPFALTAWAATFFGSCPFTPGTLYFFDLSDGKRLCWLIARASALESQHKSKQKNKMKGQNNDRG